MKLFSVATIGIMILTGCVTAADKAAVLTSASSSPNISPPSTQNHYLPKAVVYKTNIPVDNHPAVRVSNSGNELIYYPATHDIRETSRPLKLAGGWILDRQGAIAEDTRFLKWTFDEYAALPATPEPSVILNSLLEDVRVTAIRTLDMTLQDAMADTATINNMLRGPAITNFNK